MDAKISYEDFLKVDMRVGTIISVEEFLEAHRPAWKLQIDFGPMGIMRSSAQIKELYKSSDLLGKQVLAVINFPEKQIGSFMSQCLVLGVIGEEKGVVLIGPDQLVKNGSRIS